MAKRRHYRVAKKEVEVKPTSAKGYFINKKQEPMIASGLIGMAILIFLKGFIFGWLIDKNRF